mgnify:CR=1 FL=1
MKDKWVRFLSLIICIFFLFNYQLCFAGDPIRKLSRGLANVACGWGEFPKEILQETERSGDIGGLLVAPFKGIAKFIGRTAVGVYEVITFLIPIPRNYEPVIDPEFVF